MRFKKSARYYALLSLFIVLCLLTVLVVLLPIGIQLSTQSWLRGQGLDANIEFVGFNLNSGTFLLEDAKATNKNSKGFSLDRLLLEVNWRPLFDKKLDIQRIEVEGLELDIEKSGESLVIAGIDINKLSAASEKPQTKTSNESAEPLTWSAQVQQITLSNIKLCQYTDVATDKILTIESMMHACTAIGSMKWRGNLGWLPPEKNNALTSGIAIAGNIQLDNLLVANHDSSQTFASMDSLVIDALKVSGIDKVNSKSIQIKGMALLQHSSKPKAPYLASWKNLNIDSVALDLTQQRATVNAITLAGLKSAIDRSKTGIAGLPVLEKQQTNKQLEEPGQAFSFAINNIKVNGNSAVSINDRTVDPIFKESLGEINLSIKHLDSAKPEVKSPLSAQLKVSEYGQVNVEGAIQPFAKRITIDLKQDIKHIDLANYNVYGKTFIGHRIHSGHLNLEQKLTITSGKLDTESVLVLNKFKVESLEGEEAEKYKSDLGIPLSAALSLLRDRDDNIHLTIPVTGDMDDPNFSLNDVISTVTSKVIKEAIINYYTPFGLLSLLGGVIDLAAGLSFEPVVFIAGKAELQQAGIDNMNKLSKLLSERPHVQLTLCGQPVKSDIFSKYKLKELGLKKGEEQKPFKLNDKQTSELLALFRTRMDNMKKYMVKQLKVNPGQVLLCSEPDNKQWQTGIENKPEIAITI